jgi:hypothetical protein
VCSVEAEKQVALRTSELRASSPSFMTASPRASLRVSTAAAGGDESGLGSPFAAAPAAGSGGGAGSLPSSPLASGGGAGGSGSFAFTRSTCYRATLDGMEGLGSPSQANAYMQVRCDVCCCLSYDPASALAFHTAGITLRLEVVHVLHMHTRSCSASGILTCTPHDSPMLDQLAPM